MAGRPAYLTREGRARLDAERLELVTAERERVQARLRAAREERSSLPDGEYQAARDWPLGHVEVKLDDKPVYAADGPPADKPISAYAGFAAAGLAAGVARRPACPRDTWPRSCAPA